MLIFLSSICECIRDYPIVQKIVQFSRPPTPCRSTSKILPFCWLSTSNFKQNPHLQMITNQLKENIIQGCLLYVSRSFLQFDFLNSLILLGFPLTSFHLAEASRSIFSWLYTLMCEVLQKYHEMSFIYNYSHLSIHFAINLFYLHNLKT